MVSNAEEKALVMFLYNTFRDLDATCNGWKQSVDICTDTIFAPVSTVIQPLVHDIWAGESSGVYSIDNL